MQMMVCVCVCVCDVVILAFWFMFLFRVGAKPHRRVKEWQMPEAAYLKSVCVLIVL